MSVPRYFRCWSRDRPCGRFPACAMYRSIRFPSCLWMLGLRAQISTMNASKRSRPHASNAMKSGVLATLRPRTCRALSARHVLGLSVAKTPDFIALDACGLDRLDAFIVEICARSPSIHKQLGNRIDRYIAHAGNRPHGRSLDQHRKYRGTDINRQPVHLSVPMPTLIVDNGVHYPLQSVKLKVTIIGNKSYNVQKGAKKPCQSGHP